jgi:hypothetical protein
VLFIGDEFLRRLWRMEIDCVDPRRLVFVDEMGTHTSLAPLLCLRTHRRASVL